MAAGRLAEPWLSGVGRARQLAIIGALLGLFASAYLAIDYTFGSAICLTGSGCDLVRTSGFAYPLGIPMPLLGIGFYLVAFLLLLDRWLPPVARSSTAILAWAGLGLVVMGALTVIEVFVIGALCGWCLVSALASVLLFVGARGLRRDGEAPVEEPRSSRDRRAAAVREEARDRGLARFAGLAAAVAAAAFAVLIVATYAVGSEDGGGAAAPDDVVDRATLGSGPVRVEVFSDFQCPACAVAAPLLEQLAGDGTVTVTYRYFPLLSIHPNAMAAAVAAEAARSQNAFWPYHDALFANQSAWASLTATDADAAFAQLADQLGLDTAAWSAFRSTAKDVVETDLAEAKSLQLRGTPSIFIGGTAYQGGLDLASLRAAVATAR
jgi:protein-disulfide isomerase